MLCSTSHQHLSEPWKAQRTWTQPSATTVLSWKGFGAGNTLCVHGSRQSKETTGRLRVAAHKKFVSRKAPGSYHVSFAYWNVDPEGCGGSKKLARVGDISPHRISVRLSTAGYVPLAGSSHHSPAATICRYSVAGPTDGRLRKRPEMRRDEELMY